jgi:hypothetical protein
MHPHTAASVMPRVSTCRQMLDTQLEQLRGAGGTKIYREMVTGAHNDRRELLKMLDFSLLIYVNRITQSITSMELFNQLPKSPNLSTTTRRYIQPWKIQPWKIQPWKIQPWKSPCGSAETLSVHRAAPPHSPTSTPDTPDG